MQQEMRTTAATTQSEAAGGIQGAARPIRKVAWIGLGAMGLPMARNLVRAGFDVRAFNRTPRDYNLGGGRLCASAREAVDGCDAVILMVADGAAVREVLFGPDGVADHVPMGTLIVNQSTIGVEETQAVAQRLAQAGLEFMDAPVSGSVQPAEQGQLVVLAGGSAEAFARMQPVFAAMARHAFHLGPVGRGAAMKLLVNAYLGVVVEAAGECLTAADKAGLGREAFLKVLAETGMWSPILAMKRPLWTADEYAPAFALKHMRKDLRLAQAFLGDLGHAGAAIQAALSAYDRAADQGLADADMAAVARALAEPSA
ncbi:NAD(P)-dependent oxidoreductase [Alicyclobacillus kakegawensis]|uniref:NAD(P)-dependent oxidoreductase n=1 Tax=Alicyclobacillus kakegawensis TaxID=392012 RepID=UPI000835D5D1|nr:NAD(P)-dependent oxidoreductase [Alicyclobacillus kakegawensis]